jgi:transcriptional regulator with XRE-family HTH domain
MSICTNYANSEKESNTKFRDLHDFAIIEPCYKGQMKLILKEIRRAKGLTQGQLAELASMSVSYLSEIERGVKQINAGKLDALAKALDVRPRDLIQDDLPTQLSEHISNLEHMSEEDRETVLRLAESLASKAR